MNILYVDSINNYNFTSICFFFYMHIFNSIYMLLKHDRDLILFNEVRVFRLKEIRVISCL